MLELHYSLLINAHPSASPVNHESSSLAKNNITLHSEEPGNSGWTFGFKVKLAKRHDYKRGLNMKKMMIP